METSQGEDRIPAISVRQPWAGAIALLDKNVENRSSPKYKHRGLIIVHASSHIYSREEGLEMLAVAARGDPDPELFAEIEADVKQGTLRTWMLPGRIL